MATLSGHCDAQRENERDERDAQVGRQAGGDGAVPSQAEIRCECAFTYMNAVSGKNLTGVFSSMKSMRAMAHDIGGALRSVMDEARFCRTTATCIWGVSDPRKSGAGP